MIDASSVVEKFSGLGGNIWPPDFPDSNDARKMQSSIDKGRSYLDIGKSFQMYVVTDFARSDEYYKFAKNSLEALFLELSIPGTETNVDGYDFGNPEGGLSIIETEILSCQNYLLAKQYLNPRNGLFNSIDALNGFLNSVDEVEDLESYCAVGIKCIK